MDKSDAQKFAALLAGLAEAYRQEISAVTIRAYQMALEDLPYEAIERAVIKGMRTCKFMPTAAELRELTGLQSHDDRAPLAWLEFSNAVERIGSYKSVDFADRTINAVVRSLGGWQYCCSLPASEFDKWLRQTFLKTYASMSRAEVDGEACDPLLGYFDTENAKSGYPTSHPICIGQRDSTPRRRLTRDIPTIELKKP